VINISVARHLSSQHQVVTMLQHVLALVLLPILSAGGVHTEVSDHHLVGMEQLLKLVDKHVLQPPLTGLTRRRKLVKRPVGQPSRHRRTAEGGQQKFPASELDEEPRKGRGGGIQYFSKGSFDNCGIQKVPFEPPTFNRIPRVRNGTCTPYGAFPWTVQIQEFRNGKYFHRCGGSLISDRHVITAHHCFGGSPIKDLRVVVGQYNINKLNDKEMAFEIDQIWYHKGYQSGNNPYSNDLAMIKLRSKGDGSGVRFSREVSPICLPEYGADYRDGLHCVISGWGQILPHGKERPECLRAAKVPILNQDKCQIMYSHSSGAVVDSMLCAGYPEGGVDACKGDSGGPLACYIDGSYKLVGVVSWGLGCGKANMPGVFTRVQYFLDWIQEKL